MTEATSSTPLLDVRGIDVAYGGIRAVRQLNLHVHPGELVALIGANGAGKSTTLRAICGLVPLAAGSIHYQGQSLAGQPVHSMVRQGLVMVPEGRGIFPQLTIEENLYMGAYTRTDKDGVAQDLEGVFTRFPRLAERRKQTAGTLSGGEQQMLAMGRAILSQPKLLLLDEPTMGLAPIMVDKIFEVIADISQRGVTILLIEQNARLALEVSQRGYVLESGELTLQGPAHDLLHDPKVRAAYLGE
ncbi:ABC transporter ATP-binding protein [Comamonas aquatica]|jgi:branched-chain amino acid transport system ATP-binding protein|uniref:ABC transporter ATP-binding protein n=1 Tax=Comamonas aquatica TaxID=225991 RepID=A0AA43AVZ5_9BURK|nr:MULTISPECIES: ABC transporter ATP-binding protein [Comamonas]MDH0371758.1 ABC transporter ATP-binding protein [Comamonas aquatica]MDH0494819.1 ABC transporter ATP-binding protein [Comamonas aquatica]MDH0901073.1 ABC transporter ATP-binding protein [Comamonas aquatica]MDH1380369.1 ABC transporter ATP-binding protein [Comamonas aquatica]MDH1429076.1 ABC transporter ATP-binding protein [Comamonas aquatica]